MHNAEDVCLLQIPEIMEEQGEICIEHSPAIENSKEVVALGQFLIDLNERVFQIMVSVVCRKCNGVCICDS